MRAKLIVTFALIATIYLPATPTTAQDEASAKAFLNSIIRLYDKSGPGVGVTNKYLHSSLVALIQADVKATGSDVPGVLDGDLLCLCQEWDGFWVHQMTLKMVTPKRAQVMISFSVYAPNDRPKDDLRRIQITLVPERGQWRIYDILDISVAGSEQWKAKNLRGQLQEEIDSYNHPTKSQTSR
jgi:hypothetical protein